MIARGRQPVEQGFIIGQQSRARETPEAKPPSAISSKAQSKNLFNFFTQTDRLPVSFPRKRESRILSRFWIPVFTGMTGCFILFSRKHLYDF